MRYATLDERKEFYTAEFNTAKVAEWFGTRLTRTKFAVIMGRHTRIYPEKYREDADTTIIIDEYNSLKPCTMTEPSTTRKAKGQAKN